MSRQQPSSIPDRAAQSLRDDALNQICEARDLSVLDSIKVRALGKSGWITGLMKGLGKLEREARREKGAFYNELKDEIERALAIKREAIENAVLEKRLHEEHLDVTLPVRPTTQGCIHPISHVMEELVAIFADMGFSVAEGPDVEDDFHNFTALNIPPDHPARQLHDTFYLDAEQEGEPLLLRTHTSPVQIRTMQAAPPPYRIVAPGRTYRRDSDITHTPMFHQLEGLLVDRRTHMGHLKGCLTDFVRAFFERDDVPVRFRPHNFPFTFLSAEMDIACRREHDTLVIGEGQDWLEILGCGMVHPNVLRAVGVDAEEWQGFAFGMGVDRLAMLKYGIPDIRAFFDADLRWLRHYGFVPLDVPTMHGGLSG